MDELPTNPLDALRELTHREGVLDELRRERIMAARAAGASWEQVGEALGMSRQSAWEYFSAETRERLAANAAANKDLSEEEAMALAVSEVKAVRRQRRAS